MIWNKSLLLFLAHFMLVVGFRMVTVSAESHTYFASKSFQNEVVMNGSGPPISEKKLSAFSVEDHQGDDG